MEDDLRKLRVRFQRALLGLLRTDDRSSEFLVLEDTLRALGALAESTSAKDVWTRCRGWIETIRTSQERPKPGYIRFLRMVDQSLKVWLDVGQTQFEAREIPRLEEELEALTSDEVSPHEAWSVSQDERGRGTNRLEKPEVAVNGQGFSDKIAPQGGVPAPEEIRTVLSGLAAHPAWDMSGGATHQAQGSGPQADSSAAPSVSDADVEAPAMPPRRVPKDRVPLSNLLPRLDRIALQSGRELAKPVELFLDEGGYIDRRVLKGLLQPLEHIVRNAIYHGIESADARAAASKSSVGQITLRLHRGTKDARLEVETDGFAIDFERLRRKVEELGLLSPGSEPSQEDLLQCLTAPGFSTAHSATQIAGYGVGLDAAKTALETLGGRLRISNKHGEGLCFVLHLPPDCCGAPELNPV